MRLPAYDHLHFDLTWKQFQSFPVAFLMNPAWHVSAPVSRWIAVLALDFVLLIPFSYFLGSQEHTPRRLGYHVLDLTAVSLLGSAAIG